MSILVSYAATADCTVLKGALSWCGEINNAFGVITPNACWDIDLPQARSKYKKGKKRQRGLWLHSLNALHALCIACVMHHMCGGIRIPVKIPPEMVL